MREFQQLQVLRAIPGLCAALLHLCGSLFTAVLPAVLEGRVGRGCGSLPHRVSVLCCGHVCHKSGQLVWLPHLSRAQE